jgi:hypothetical protein
MFFSSRGNGPTPTGRNGVRPVYFSAAGLETVETAWTSDTDRIAKPAAGKTTGADADDGKRP